ncbi:MAG: hypothetical protein IKR38_06340 [Bacteroidales bacterium]|nr:hypothetical protein [Bacteroidales bacterium]
MKKLFYFAAMAAVLVSFAACEKGNKPGRNDDDDDDGPAYVNPIKIDGNFADWAALDASKVATATCATGRTDTDALKTLKVYCDEYYLSFYIEFDKNKVDPYSATALPFHIYLNSDNSAATGGYGDEFADADADWCLEASLLGWDASGTVQSWDPSAFKWWGEPGQDGWLWTEHSVNPNVPEHSDADQWGAIKAGGIAEGAGSVADGKYEAQIDLSALPFTLADTFTIGADIQQNWSSIGWLPNAAQEESNPSGKAKKLVVIKVK